MLLVEINELNITDLLLWIIVQRLKLINVEHIVFECRARDGRVDVSNGCWWHGCRWHGCWWLSSLWSRCIWGMSLFGVFLLHFFYFGDDLVRLTARRFLQVLILVHIMWYHLIWFIWYGSYRIIQFICYEKACFILSISKLFLRQCFYKLDIHYICDFESWKFLLWFQKELILKI